METIHKEFYSCPHCRSKCNCQSQRIRPPNSCQLEVNSFNFPTHTYANIQLYINLPDSCHPSAYQYLPPPALVIIIVIKIQKYELFVNSRSKYSNRSVGYLITGLNSKHGTAFHKISSIQKPFLGGKLKYAIESWCTEI